MADVDARQLFLEFSTPLFVTTWKNSDRYKELLLDIVKNSAAAQPVSDNRVAAPSIRTSSMVVDAPENIFSSTKYETSDNIHTQFPQLRPLFDWCLHEVTMLLQEKLGTTIPDHVDLCITNAWGNSYRHGDYHNMHNHPGASFSGVYCIMDQTSRYSTGGMIDFLDPRYCVNYYEPAVSLFGNDTRRFKLKEGQLIVFPSWLKHFVNPLGERENRATVSMNFDFLISDRVSGHPV